VAYLYILYIYCTSTSAMDADCRDIVFYALLITKGGVRDDVGSENMPKGLSTVFCVQEKF
jgi:hypothetical protein